MIKKSFDFIITDLYAANTCHASQLHRIAFMEKQSKQFISLDNESISLQTPLRSELSSLSTGLFELDEVSVWTLCGIGKHIPF